MFYSYAALQLPNAFFLLYSLAMTILDKILKEKRSEVDTQSKEQPLALVQAVAHSRYKPRGFAAAIAAAERPAIIAEIKRGSPSRGVFRRSLDPVEAAHAFSRGQAACLSILTDAQFFAGSISFVPLVRDHLQKSGLHTPILRKDFIIDPYQVWQSKAIGADAVLLILAALDEQQYQSLLSLALELELDVLIEVHNTEELQAAIRGLQAVYPAHCNDTIESDPIHNGKAQALLGINNRDLHSFVCDLEVTERLAAEAQHLLQESAPALHSVQLISESGIHHRADIDRLLACGVDGFLVGESIVAEGDLEQNLRALRAVGS